MGERVIYCIKFGGVQYVGGVHSLESKQCSVLSYISIYYVFGFMLLDTRELGLQVNLRSKLLCKISLTYINLFYFFIRYISVSVIFLHLFLSLCFIYLSVLFLCSSYLSIYFIYLYCFIYLSVLFIYLFYLSI